jgi:hypothetical protein
MTSTESDAIADVGAELEATGVDVRAVRADLRAAEGVETLYAAVTASGGR